MIQRALWPLVVVLPLGAFWAGVASLFGHPFIAALVLMSALLYPLAALMAIAKRGHMDISPDHVPASELGVTLIGSQAVPARAA